MLIIHEIGNVHERIDQLAQYFCKGNKAAFGRRADIQSGVLAGIIGGRKNKPSFEVLQKILSGYPSVNPEWLLFGRGSMLQKKGKALANSAIAQQLVELKQEMDFITLRLTEAQQLLEAYNHEQARISDLTQEILNRKADDVTPEDETRYHGLAEELTKSIAYAKLQKELVQQYEKRLGEKQQEYVDSVQRVDESPQSEERASQLFLSTIYRVDGKPDIMRYYNGLLTERLRISRDVALQLVTSGKIRAVAVEGGDYRVTEQAVREFLGEA